MTTAFVDTTVVVDAVLKRGSLAADKANRALQTFDLRQIPWYAIKEFDAGPFFNTVYAHNLLAREPLHEAYAILERTRARNKAATARQAIMAAVTAVDVEVGELARQAQPGFSPLDSQRQNARVHLKRVIYQSWNNRTKLDAAYVDPLACLRSTMGPTENAVTGFLDFKQKRCIDGEQGCSAAGLMASNKRNMKKLRDAVNAYQTTHPKEENVCRAKVLGQMISKPGAPISEKDCRSIGDAYFAERCPQGGTVLTTNVSDHAPLAQALGKQVQAP